MCFERPAGSFRKNTKTRLCRFFVGERRAVKHIRTALRFQPYGRTRRSPCRRVAANKIRETVLPDGLPFLYHCFSPLYTDAKARCKQAKTCASFAVSPSQGTAQPTAAWKNRRAAPQRRFGTGVCSAAFDGRENPLPFVPTVPTRPQTRGRPPVVYGSPDAGTRRHAAGCTVTTQAEAQGGPPLSPTALLWNPICLNTRSALRHTRPARG